MDEDISRLEHTTLNLQGTTRTENIDHHRKTSELRRTQFITVDPSPESQSCREPRSLRAPRSMTISSGADPSSSANTVSTQPDQDASQQASASPSPVVSHPLLRHESTLILSPPPPPLTLSQNGIKVRDFAYESTLPPIAPILRLPRQVQPSPRPLKRLRLTYSDVNEDEDNGDFFLQRTSPVRPDPGTSTVQEGTVVYEDQDSERSKPLGRTMTEFLGEDRRHPSIFMPRPHDSNLFFPPRAENDRDIAHQLSPIHYTADQPYAAHPFFSQSQTPVTSTSQDSELYVDTPLITPNGSFEWPIADNSTIPASQLDAESQEQAPILVSLSELGLPETQSENPNADELVSLTAPATHFPSPKESSLPLTMATISDPSSLPGHSSGSSLHVQLTDESRTETSPSPPRYFLRKRPRPHTVGIPSRPLPAITVQSSHAKKNSGSPTPQRATRSRQGGTAGEAGLEKPVVT